MPIAPTRQAVINRLAELAGPENPGYIAVKACIALVKVLGPDNPRNANTQQTLSPRFPPLGGSCPVGTEGGSPIPTPEAPMPDIYADYFDDEDDGDPSNLEEEEPP